MKCNPFRWLWGLIPIALLSGFTVFIEKPRIEADLQRRLQEALGRHGAGWAVPTFSGRDGVVVGEAPEESEQKKAIAIARGVWGVRRVNDRTAVIEEQRNYVWSAALRDNRLKLSGFVPNEGTRKAIIGAAKATFPGRDIEDRMKLARGAPTTDVWLGGVSFGLKQLARLKSGARVDLDGTGLVIAGETEELSAYQSVKSALVNHMPHGIKLKSERVLPPAVKPYRWLANLANNQLQLEGYVPGEGARDDILNAAKKALPKAVIVDRMQPGSGEPKEFLGAIATVLAQVAQLEEGAVELNDNHLTVTGLATTQEIAAAVDKTLRSDVPASIKSEPQIKFREASVQTVSPFTTAVAIDAGAVVLSGFIPSDALRAAALEAANELLAGMKVEDGLQVGGGAPEGWQACFNAGLSGLGRLGNGRFQMTDRAMEFVGEAEDGAHADAVRGEVQAAANGACDAEFKISVTAPPGPDAGSSAEQEAKDRADAAAAAAAEEAAQSAEEERMRAEAEAEEQRLRAEADRKAEEERLRAEADRKAEEERLQAEANRKAEEERKRIEEERAAEQAKRRAEQAAAQRLETAALQRAEEASRCQQMLSTTAKTGIIRFRRASDDLERASFPTLNQLAQIVNTCPEVRIEIEGHTDAEGTPTRNKRLSQRRAQSVAEYLTRAGVPAERLTAVGYGETRPVAPNDTIENRARNRRIEFAVTAN
jgi:OmpA-OmpF porin, OOP family